jgi:hypothetical protein
MFSKSKNGKKVKRKILIFIFTIALLLYWVSPLIAEIDDYQGAVDGLPQYNNKAIVKMNIRIFLFTFFPFLDLLNIVQNT